MDNPKLAAKYFLNAIDRVDALKEKYQKNLHELKQNIQITEQIVIKPFEKDAELAQLKIDVARLEREISIKIQTNQMKQHGNTDMTIDSEKIKAANDVKLKDAPVIKLCTGEDKQQRQEKESLLVKKKFRKVKARA